MISYLWLVKAFGRIFDGQVFSNQYEISVNIFRRETNSLFYYQQLNKINYPTDFCSWM